MSTRVDSLLRTKPMSPAASRTRMRPTAAIGGVAVLRRGETSTVGRTVRRVQLTRTFDRCVFDAATVRRGLETYEGLPRETPITRITRVLYDGPDRWSFDDDDEFFAAYTQGFVFATYEAQALSELGDDDFKVEVNDQATDVKTRISAGRAARGEIERVVSVFSDVADTAYRREPPRPPQPPDPPPEPPTIFIGHGGSPVWRDLKDHLQDQHGYAVEAYETGARAGHAIRDILEQMLSRSSFAVLVMTAEDEQSDGGSRARQNVVHEAGLFQGRLGFDRAVVAIERGAESFSNLEGIHQLRFGQGNVREVFGDVLATLRREFPDRAR